jgi:NAD(P)-dependent dehydrogenase (short-subunit alcohol dehydrogenase family)
VRRIVVAGASRGIGAAVAAHYAAAGAEVIALSRTPAPVGRWIEVDLADRLSLARAVAAIGPGPVDALLVTGGIWEEGAFTPAYSFEASPADETSSVIAVNLTAPILLTQALIPQLRTAAAGRVVFLGALSGLEQSATPEVANSASKYGLRGAAQALDLTLRTMGIGVTVINPGNVATDEVLADIAAGRFPDQAPIPMADLLAAFDFALSLSPATVAREINLAQMRTAPQPRA